MIRIDHITEVPESKSDTSKEYLNIKPIENISVQEASDFIAAEFKKAHDEAGIDIYDRLLSEIFNCEEEDIDITFDVGAEIGAVLEEFKQENWEVIDKTEQLSDIKELVDIVGESLGLDKLPKVLISDEKNDIYGSYNSEKNEIMLNGKFLSNPVEIVNTITHELRHAYQHMRAEILETYEDALYKVNFENYISTVYLPAGGCLYFTDYMDQYVEVDARVFANLFTETMK